jgi:ribose 1,5-bisphosphokinase
MSERLIYVVGPSGAGKDSLLNWLREQTPQFAPVHWAKRTINRLNTDKESSDLHEGVDSDEFESLLAKGVFAMQWEANTHRYGIRRSELSLLNNLTHVILVNGSRLYMPIAASLYPGLTFLHITAKPSVLRERIHLRGRESVEEINARLNRQIELIVPNGCQLMEVHNDSTLESAGQQLIAQLQTLKCWPFGFN